ncbi:MAG: major capsid protein [Acidobacteriota bacterium]|nr:major capsid protein [Acidobacteriota bacterium]
MSSLINIFNNDAFTLMSLTAAINKMPHKPGRIGSLGLFQSEGITTDVAVIEELDGSIALVQTSQPGAPAATVGGDKRKVRSFVVPHLKKESTILPQHVQGVRAFGSENATEGVQAVVAQRQAKLKGDLDVTLERHRVGAIKGLVLDADDSTLFNLFTEFGVSQQTAEIDLNSDGEEIRRRCVEIQRLSENELGAEAVTGYRAFCGDTFFDQLVEHPDVKESLKYQESQTLRKDLRKGFEYGGITFENYRGSVNGTKFFADAECFVVPEGTGIFITRYAPAKFLDTVNTVGLPYYSRVAIDPQMQEWAKVHAQSNPLNLCTRPRAVIKVVQGS